MLPAQSLKHFSQLCSGALGVGRCLLSEGGRVFEAGAEPVGHTHDSIRKVTLALCPLAPIELPKVIWASCAYQGSESKLG